MMSCWNVSENSALADGRRRRSPRSQGDAWSSGVRFTGHPEWPDTGPAETEESGLVLVVVAREQGSSARVCEFLVDTWCLGVKNALGPKSVERRTAYATWNSPGR
jgi:hypothetical protein